MPIKGPGVQKGKQEVTKVLSPYEYDRQYSKYIHIL